MFYSLIYYGFFSLSLGREIKNVIAPGATAELSVNKTDDDVVINENRNPYYSRYSVATEYKMNKINLKVRLIICCYC